MYNGIGLQTARGSGTNGYVQRNLSFVKQLKNKIDYKSEDDFKRLEKELNRVPNKEILEHQNKRQIELKCLQMQELMEEQGYSEEEIESKVKTFRETLIKQMETTVVRKKEWILDNSPQNVKETHKLAEMNVQKNDNLKNALRIDPYFIEGSSLDPTRKAKEAMAKEVEALQKRRPFLEEPSPEPVFKSVEEIKTREKPKKSGKNDSNNKVESTRKHNSESESESDSESYSSDERSKKRRKNKSNENRKKNKKHEKVIEHKSRKRHNKSSSDSSSGSDSNSDSDSDSSSDSESESTDSSNSFDHKSRNDRKNRDNRRENRRHSPTPDKSRNKSKSYSELKGSTYGNPNNNNYSSHSIEANIRQMRKEVENSVPTDRQKTIRNDEKNKNNKRETREESSERLKHSSHSRSRSSSRSSERDSRVKRLKSTVYEMSSIKKAREVPKSYSSNYEHKRSDSRTNRSLSPEEKSRHSSRSYRSRSHSIESNDSNHSSDRSSSSESSGSRTDSRSPSIPRHKGSPSFLDKRRITRY